MVLRTMGVARGAVTRTVQCEECGCEFQYTLKRTGLGSGRLGLLSASGAAERDLESALRKADALVTCPCCGHYQQHMVARQRRFWILLAAVLAGLAVVFHFFFNALAMGAEADAKEIILPVRMVLLLVTGTAAGVSACMIVLDHPGRFPFMRIFHRGQPHMLAPGQAVAQGPSARPEAAPEAPSNGVRVDADFFLNRDAEPAEPQPISKVTVRCDHCGKSYTIPADRQGRSAKCKCGMTFRT